MAVGSTAAKTSRGTPGPVGSARLTSTPPPTAGSRRCLLEESADVLNVYDAAGGYGHPDHVHVHRVGIRAAAIAGTPIVLEATVDRRLI